MEVTTTMNSINNNGGREDLCWFLFFQLFSLDTKQKVKKKLSSKWNASIFWNFIEQLKKKILSVRCSLITLEKWIQVFMCKSSLRFNIALDALSWS